MGGIFTDTINNLTYITHMDSNNVSVYSQQGFSHIVSWGQEGSQDGEFRHPQGVAVNNSGYVYVTDADNNRIQVFDVNGNFVGQAKFYKE